MRITRRYWATVGVGGVLTTLAILAQRPTALIGAAGIGAWLLTTQFLAAKRMAAVPNEHSVLFTTESTHAAVSGSLFATLTVDRQSPTAETLEITAPLPTAAHGPNQDARTVHLGPNETSTTTTFELSFPVAGQYTLPEPTLTIRDWSGQFEETIKVGKTTTVTVEPNEPRDIHVGQGGELVTSVYGEHNADQTGSGLIPAEIRQYEPGDALSRIDWKATARMDHPHVREFETETDRQTALLLDHRAAMNLGAEGTSMLDYAREVALWLTDVAQEHDDPLGLYTIGDGGTTIERQPVSKVERYEEIRTQLRDLKTTEVSSDLETGQTIGRQPMRTQILARYLRNEHDAFATKLQPFLSTVDTYIHRVMDDPLYEAVRRQQSRRTGNVWTALITDDSRREETMEAVRLASSEGNHVLVFLTPRVLYEGGSLADLSDAYHRYVEFEEFRRRLDGLPRVSAFEVTPGERLQSLLTSQRQGWSQEQNQRQSSS